MSGYTRHGRWLAAHPGRALVSLGAAWVGFGTACAPNPDLASGVSWDLAQHRARTISDVRYEILMSIPDSLEQRILARETVRFTLSDATAPVVLDFRSSPGDVLAVRADGKNVRYKFINQHIVVPQTVLHEGENALDIEFLAGDLSLNRNPSFLYTLFVPDRAATAFPAFDQPNLKAVFRLALETPVSWRAVANAPLAAADTVGHRVTHTFAPTRPISTYLFSFAAGEFEVESAQRAGRAMRMYHRETDTLRVARNRDAVFDLHASALQWLEEYTGIPYPFDKFDFLLVPGFQYGGMEHPGAILYRAPSLLLEESATQSQELGRASLIAHETAHMWFGDLVTMDWFDDVWTKEVFANFMAAKIVNPSFPDIDHRLRFFLRHFPEAYDVDRTAGANPIRQELENLKEAGTLYGAIIYQKAPIVMQHLERLTGEAPFRNGLREYLETFAYANATWPALIDILDRLSEEDLQTWSQVWVHEPGRPTVETTVLLSGDRSIQSIRLEQRDPAGRGRLWSQYLQVTLGWDDSLAVRPVHLSAQSAEVEGVAGLPAPRFVLAGGDGVGYARFTLDEASATYLLERLPSIEDPMTRATAWVTLWDAMLDGGVAPQRLLDLARSALPAESEQLVTQRVLSYVQAAYWRFISAEQRRALAPDLESLLWELLSSAAEASRKSSYFSAYVDIALTEDALTRIEGVWRDQAGLPGLPLAESDYTSMAEQLALREVAGSPAILAEQRDRIGNPDRRARFEFVMPALSSDPATRDSFFTSLREAKHREHEPWVLSGLGFLHHPLRAAASAKYVEPSLEMLEEIQATGDIFFPGRWLDATLGGHNSRGVAEVVTGFLEARPDYPRRLREKIEQSADLLVRAVSIAGG